MREKIALNEIKLIYIPTKEMIADSLTKPVGRQIIERSRKEIFRQANRLLSLRECVRRVN